MRLAESASVEERNEMIVERLHAAEQNLNEERQQNLHLKV